MIPKSGFFPCGLVLLVFTVASAQAQFQEDFNSTGQAVDPAWRYFSGDGTVDLSFSQRDGFARFSVDSTPDELNIWWAAIAYSPSQLDQVKLAQPEYELRLEARVRTNTAPRRINLHANHSRSTDFHSHLKEFEIPTADEWHTVSMTTQGFDAQANDTINVQLALMDWGIGKYDVDIDYYKADVVMGSSASPDLGEALPYHPTPAPVDSFSFSQVAAQSAVVSSEEVNKSFGYAPLLTITQKQFAILRWDFTACKDALVDGSGLLVLTAKSLVPGNNPDMGFNYVRVHEIFAGKENRDEKNITYITLLQGQSYEEVFNTQMIIDWPLETAGDKPAFFTLPRPIMQRLLDGRTKGLAIHAFGTKEAKLYSRQSSSAAPRVLFNLKSASDPTCSKHLTTLNSLKK